ncbi:leucine-rich repeat protein [Acinetobacter sp.]|uniref:leucine-rich repeat domain-containing protein n=1 Tax=Acinetobacter sp. TaxID=472 RepID=UPI0028AD9BE8|nr:leucine-rich repeat protein [Acinetobacter sp.]
MATYTGVADANGDFIVPFLASYTSGQKVTVTAEKEGATKTIELFAPSDVLGGGAIQFSGNMGNFPNNIGVITLTDQIAGIVQANAMRASVNDFNMFYRATGLIIEGAVTEFGDYAFADWRYASSLILPSTLTKIGQYALLRFGNASTGDFNITLPNSVNTLDQYSFSYANMKNFDLGTGVTIIPQQCFSYTNKLETFNYRNATTVKENAFYGSNLKYNYIPETVTTIEVGSYQHAKSVEVSIGAGVTSIPAYAFFQNTFCTKFTLGINVASIASNSLSGLSACNELICQRATPPTITADALIGLKSTCVIKVPAASLAAYQAATNWSVHASKMLGV